MVIGEKIIRFQERGFFIRCVLFLRTLFSIRNFCSTLFLCTNLATAECLLLPPSPLGTLDFSHSISVVYRVKKQKHLSLISNMSKLKVDVLFLQETHCKDTI